MINGRDVLLTERRGHVYILTINRPERYNAMSIELTERINEEILTFDSDPDLWVMVLTAVGEKAFCSGMDLKEFSERTEQGQPITMQVFTGPAHHTVPTWKPIIAAVNGFAYAGGWLLAQRCDLRIASETATFGVTENKWNLAAYFVGEKDLFPTTAIANEVVMMGRPITAQRAYEIGFVNKVVPPDQLLAEALDWADHLCTLGQEAVRGHKKLLYFGSWAPTSEIWELGKDIFYWMGTGKPGVVVDSTVGSRAFAEKRQPDYSEMFHPKRLRCRVCASEFVVARDHDADGFSCHGEPAEEMPRQVTA